MVKGLKWANDRLNLNASATILTRSSPSFPSGDYRYIIHAAPETPGDANVLLTRRVLEFAQSRHADKLLYTSSGAVYRHQTEYAQLKRTSESVLGKSAVIARLFAFVGPYLKLDANFAIGNFLHDVLNGDPIRIQGDGTPVRTYLYAGDLAAWLWTLLIEGQGVYDVGGNEPISIADLAHRVAKLTVPETEVKILGVSEPDRYIPDTARAKLEHNLQTWTPLDEAIRRTYDWNRSLRLIK